MCCVCVCVVQGLVKLADFGVAAKLGELEEQHCDELHQNVVGTPYWMAPEASSSAGSWQWDSRTGSLVWCNVAVCGNCRQPSNCCVCLHHKA
jgi:serine/threonine protein kinase